MRVPSNTDIERINQQHQVWLNFDDIQKSDSIFKPNILSLLIMASFKPNSISWNVDPQLYILFINIPTLLFPNPLSKKNSINVMFVTDLSKITCKAYNIQSKKEWKPKFLPNIIT